MRAQRILYPRLRTIGRPVRTRKETVREHTYRQLIYGQNQEPSSCRFKTMVHPCRACYIVIDNVDNALPARTMRFVYTRTRTAISRSILLSILERVEISLLEERKLSMRACHTGGGAQLLQ